MTRKEWEAKYRHGLEYHIACVREAGMILGVSKSLLEMHDDSKFSKEEFGAYARAFSGPRNDPTGFARAWLHHIHNNPHHWQHWRFPDDYTTGTEKGAVVMPLRYCLEMVADWMGSSKAYTGSFSMDEWLKANIGRIAQFCHPKTMERVYDILNCNGYYPITEMLSQWGVAS